MKTTSLLLGLLAVQAGLVAGEPFAIEPITIEVPKVVMKRTEGKPESVMKYTIIGALYDDKQVVLDGVVDKKNHNPGLNPYDLLNEVLMHYKAKEFDKLPELFSPGSRPNMEQRLSHPERGQKIRDFLSKTEQFEVVAAWLLSANRLMVLTKTSEKSLPVPQMLAYEGRWYMVSGETGGSDVDSALNALYASNRTNSSIKVSKPTPEELLGLASAEAGKLARELKITL